MCFPGWDTTSRQYPTVTDPTRPPRATAGATFLAAPDADLAALVAAWPTLPEAIRAGIVAMVKAAALSCPPRVSDESDDTAPREGDGR